MPRHNELKNLLVLLMQGYPTPGLDEWVQRHYGHLSALDRHQLGAMAADFDAVLLGLAVGAEPNVSPWAVVEERGAAVPWSVRAVLCDAIDRFVEAPIAEIAQWQ